MQKKQTLFSSFLLSVFIFFSTTTAVYQFQICLTETDKKELGKKIWNNECACSIQGLTSWNQSEPFPSLGIGHFIWYPKNTPVLFEQTFPELISFLEQSIKVPSWLIACKKSGCPWSTKEQFIKEFHSKKMVELRTLLQETVPLQTDFIIEKLRTALCEIQPYIAPEKKEHFYKYVNKLLATAGGTYALIDYTNFKGTGINKQERYNNHGWGLLQVIEHALTNTSTDPLENFIQAAKTVLTKRVELSPDPLKESRWLAGWINRVESYRT